MFELSAHFTNNGLSKKLLHKEMAARKAMECTMRDLKRRAPVKVAQQVAKVYAIKQAEVKPGNGRMGGDGHVQAKGQTVAEFALVYTGRVMTPIHFRMSPSAPPGGRRYTIKATIKKGSRVTIGHWAKPGSEGGAYARPGDSPYFLTAGNGGVMLPYQRKGHNLAKVFRTVSIPQMVGNKEVAEPAIKEINDLANQRLTYHLNRLLNKK